VRLRPADSVLAGYADEPGYRSAITSSRSPAFSTESTAGFVMTAEPSVRNAMGRQFIRDFRSTRHSTNYRPTWSAGTGIQ
jgi:hypothetical protein